MFGLEQGVEFVFHGCIVDGRIVFQLIAGLGNLDVERIGPAGKFAVPFKVWVIAQVGVDVASQFADIIIEQILAAGIG